MQRTLIVKAALSLAALYVCACSGAGADPSARPAAPDWGAADNQPAGEEVIAEFSAGDFGVAFLESHAPDGSVMLSMRESGPHRLEGSPMQLVLDHGLTALELFRSLAPADAQVPDALVQAHATQARTLGREDVESVLDFSFTPPAVIDKSDATCDNWVFTTMNDAFRIVNPVRRTRTASDQSTQEYTSWTLSNVTVGVCNETASTMATRPYWIVQPSDPNLVASIDTVGIFSGGWTPGAPFSLAPFQAVRWYNWSIPSPETCDDFVCTRPAMQYCVQGLGNPVYRFRTAEVNTAIR